MTLVIERVALEQQRLKSGFTLLFAAGERPSADAIARALDVIDEAAPAVSISHRPDPAEGWIELITSGLTFELVGLAPAGGVRVAQPMHRFGLGASLSDVSLEGAALIPGPHIFGGRAMEPVVRAITGLAASLTLALPVAAVCWEPAGTWMEPGYFTRLVVGWLAGGPFPALGLTAIETDAAGTVRSVGLSFFCGQEVEVIARPGEAPADTIKLALRVIDNLVRRGRIVERTEFEAAAGTSLIAEPTADLTRVRVWRGI